MFYSAILSFFFFFFLGGGVGVCRLEIRFYMFFFGGIHMAAMGLHGLVNALT